MGTPSISRLIAKALILWDERVSRGILRGLDGTWRERFPDHLQRNFSAECRRLSRTDIDAALGWFLHGSESLVDWYLALLAGVEIEWRDGQPYVLPGSIEAWELLSNDFDSDALLTLNIADRYDWNGRRDGLERLDSWKTIPRVCDHELTVLWSRGLSDLHVHVGGVRFPQAAWYEMLSNASSARLYKSLDRVYRAHAAPLAGHDDVGQGPPPHSRGAGGLRAYVEEVRSSRRRLLGSTLGAVPAQLMRRPTSRRWWGWSSDGLWQERSMLVEAWSKAANKRDEASEVVRHLDEYLCHKHRFFRLVRQRAFPAEPGLRQFDVRYFAALRKTSPRDKWRVPSLTYGSSPRLEMTPFGDACSYLLESANLERIELRIAPFDRASNYFRFFRLWQLLDQQLAEYRGNAARIRFAVHFIRTHDRNGPDRSVRPVSQASRRLRQLDRQSAALRAALSSPDPRCRDWMKALARIDVAGQERDTPCGLFATHLRLLRGDPKAIEILESPPDDGFGEWLTCWRRLKVRGDHRPRLGDTRLGMTAHAGEDFADVLDGLYNIGVAIDALGLGAGDGIGHALALTSGLDPPGRGVQWSTMMPSGAALDSLCWLLDFLDAHDRIGENLHYREPLRTLIRDAADVVYHDLSREVRGVDASDHVWVWRYMVAPDRKAWDRASTLRQDLLRLNREERLLSARERMMPWDAQRGRVDGLVRWAQKTLIAQIRERRIVIEMNPSSNVRISGAATPEESPTVKLFQAVADGLLACINTDDPGVFATCIENEYALLLQGARGAGMNVGRARDLLERVRQVGMDVVYWPK